MQIREALQKKLLFLWLFSWTKNLLEMACVISHHQQIADRFFVLEFYIGKTIQLLDIRYFLNFQVYYYLISENTNVPLELKQSHLYWFIILMLVGRYLIFILFLSRTNEKKRKYINKSNYLTPIKFESIKKTYLLLIYMYQYDILWWCPITAAWSTIVWFALCMN